MCGYYKQKNMMIVLQLLTMAAVTIGITSERVTRQAWSDADLDSFQTLPRRAVVKPGGKVSLLGNAGVPLEHCLFYLPEARGKWPLDYSLGPASNSTDRYEYFGKGLEYGDCGIRMKRVANDDDGIITCEVKPMGSDVREKCVTTLRITTVREADLPVFNMDPRRNLVRLARGDDLTLSCNADRPLTLCHIYLPGPIFLNFDKGANSTVTSGHRYHGSGLENGDCGATLLGVTEELSGFIVCKVGSWPETVHGKWETDSLHVRTTEFLNIGRPPPPPPDRIVNRTMCPPLTSRTVEITCLFAGKVIDCSQQHKPRSVAYMDCKPGHVVPNRIIYRKVTCLKGGVWDPPPIACQPDCGRRLSNEGILFIANGTDARVGEFPWHVGIYQQDSGRFLQICGGSLISERVVVTAAHCFWNENKNVKNSAAIYKVAAGKHIREWTKESSWTQKRGVLEIIVPKEYRGRGTQYRSDIALVIVNEPFQITPVVNLVCVDWNADLQSKQLKDGNEGIVTGWGFTETGSQSDILQYVDLPYLQREMCLQSLRIEFQQLLTEDKFCAGFINEGKSVCRGDSGGGLVFRDTRLDKHYLRGLVSIAFIPGQDGVCNTQDYTGFTGFGEYHEWVLDNSKYDEKKNPIKNDRDDSSIVFPAETEAQIAPWVQYRPN